MPINVYSRLTAASYGGGDDDDCYGVFDGACASSVLMFFVLAASVIVWKACAFVAMAAVLLAVGWRCAGGSGRRAGTVVLAAAVPDGAECGLTDAAIDDALPASAYERPAAGSAAVCSVCLEDVQGGEAVRRLPACRHLYHARCIDMWLHLHTTCPMCRSDLSPRRRVATNAATAGSSAEVLLPQLYPSSVYI